MRKPNGFRFFCACFRDGRYKEVAHKERSGNNCYDVTC